LPAAATPISCSCKRRPAHRAGTFSFELGGARRRLTAYRLDGGRGDSLFLPFLDETSGHETYGAGRYLDLEPDDDGTYVYAPKFSCPLTPPGNRLALRIEAAERLPSGGEAY
jgi:uncharacterized protein